LLEAVAAAQSERLEWPAFGQRFFNPRGSVMPRDWTRGELQAFGALTKLALIIGIPLAAAAWADRLWLLFSVGVTLTAGAMALGIYLFRYSRRTGRSVTPFRSDSDPS
jgi:hypothetical protein